MIYLSGQPLDVTIFPDKTSQVWKLPPKFIANSLKYGSISIRWEFENEGEFMHLAQLIMLLRAMSSAQINLYLPYLPYGRQDKKIDNNATFALVVFANMLNFLAFDSVIITDPHSYLALKLIERSEAIYPTEEIQATIKTTKADMICYPDKGAVTKYSKVYDFGLGEPIYGEKVRDQLTGNITSYQLIGNPNGRRVLIVDDICDGGMTFKLLTKDLLAAGAKTVSLFVSHGIFSKGLQTLKDSGIKHIFTKNGEVC